MDVDTVQMVVAAGVPILGAACGVALYVVRAELRGDVTRLDGRIDTQRELQASLKDDVRYIRERIDKALNGHV